VSDPAPDPSRRSLLAGAAAGCACLGLLAHAAPWGRALLPTVRYEAPTKRRLGAPAAFPEGVTFLAQAGVFLFREENRFRALSAVCTHLGCTVQREEEGFHCPCHGSVFGKDGENRSGPAPRPLPWRPLALAADGTLAVDLGAETVAGTVLVAEEGS
jgi:menaquinol-cytochrome c reductase iron-sulfur subunit